MNPLDRIKNGVTWGQVMNVGVLLGMACTVTATIVVKPSRSEMEDKIVKSAQTLTKHIDDCIDDLENNLERRDKAWNKRMELRDKVAHERQKRIEDALKRIAR